MSTSSIVDSRYVALVFGASEAHLVPMYSNLRQRPYPPRNFFSDESGYLIPNVSIPLDVTAARESQRPPEYGVAFDWRNGTTYRALPTAVQRLLAEFGAVRCPALHGDDDYWQHLDHLLEPAREPGRLLAGLSDDAQRAITARSVTIDCRAGDHLLKTGGTARSPCLVIEGTLDVTTSGNTVRTLGPGDLFGESALLLGTARTADITVTSPQATVLCLADKAVRTSSEHQEWGRILDANLLTILATRLRDAHALTG